MAGIIERELPRISVNKLGEYMTATPSRRRQIVRDQQRPKGFLVPRYNDALAAVTNYLTAPQRDESVLVREMERLASAPSQSTWDEQRHASCRDAIEAFLDIADQLPREVELRPGSGRPPVVVYKDVSVSVRPELIAHGRDRDGNPTVGAIKFYFSKTGPLSKEAGGYIATALADFTDQFLALEAAPNYKHCLVVDVFARKIFTAPRSRARRRQDIAAACEEIGRAWPTAVNV